MSEVKEKATTFKLPAGEKVTIKPVKRSGWLPPGHDGEIRFSGTAVGFSGPELDINTRQLKTGLNEEEERALEKLMNLSTGTLSKYNKDYWASFIFMIPKDGLELYLDNPRDYIIFKLLSNHSKVAKTLSEVIDTPGADFYLTSYDEEAKLENKKGKTERDAVKAFSKLDTSDKRDVLNVYALLKGKSTGRPSKDASTDFVEDTLYKKVKDNPEEFLRIVTDKHFDTKVLIDKLVINKILLKNGPKYTVNGGDTVGSTLESTITFLEDPQNQGVYLELKNKLESINK